MFRTVCVPTSKNLVLPLPESMVGAAVEILVFPADDAAPLMPESPPLPSGDRGFGCMKGAIRMAEDFDAPLDVFREYME